MMRKSPSPAERIADMLAATSTAAEALFRHIDKVITLQDKANHTIVMGPVLDQMRCPLKAM